MYVAFIYGIYHYTENFFHTSIFRDFTFLIFTMLLMFKNIARVLVAAAIEGLKAEASHNKLYNKDFTMMVVDHFRRIYQGLRT